MTTMQVPELPELEAVSRRFVAADEPWRALRAPSYEIITGFGPTNTPTAGTLSVMIGIVELQEVLRAPMTVIISDLGAWNSRNIPWEDLCCYRDRMARFLVALGFDATRGTSAPTSTSATWCAAGASPGT